MSKKYVVDGEWLEDHLVCETCDYAISECCPTVDCIDLHMKNAGGKISPLTPAQEMAGELLDAIIKSLRCDDEAQAQCILMDVLTKEEIARVCTTEEGGSNGSSNL